MSHSDDPLPELSPFTQSVYAQDCDFARYQDGLKWSRFQTASGIEAASLYGSFNTGLDAAASLTVLGLGTGLILLLWALVWIDEIKYFEHIRRAELFERAAGVRELQWRVPKWWLPSRYAMALIVIFNLAAIWVRASHAA